MTRQAKYPDECPVFAARVAVPPVPRGYHFEGTIVIARVPWVWPLHGYDSSGLADLRYAVSEVRPLTPAAVAMLELVK